MVWLIAPILVPIIDWLPKYTRELFIYDLIGGCTVFVILIPQGMAYSLLAGLPAVYGLYSATVPLLIYALLGTSKELSMGPMAITALLLGVACQSRGLEVESPQYIQVAMNISMLVGLLTFFMGIFKMGSLVNLISHSVLVGFLSASALVIVVNQLKYIFGIHVPRFTYSIETVAYILSHLPEINPFAFLLGCLTLFGLYFVKLWKEKNKPSVQKLASIKYRIGLIIANLSNLLAILFGGLLSYFLNNYGHNVDIVGNVPSGLRSPSFEFINTTDLLSLIPTSLAISFVAFAGNWAISQKYSQLNGYEVYATQELIASGLTNIIGVIFNSFVVSGGLARTAVNVESGAKTQISGCITSVLIMIALLCLTSTFYYIPMAVLGAIIQISVVSMFNYKEMIEAYSLDKKDFFVMIITFLSTFLIGVIEGLFIGIFLSLSVVMKTVVFPQMVHMGKLPIEEGGHFKSIERFPNSCEITGVTIIRMDAPLFFGNCEYFKAAVLAASKSEYNCRYHTSSDITNESSTSHPVKQVIIDCSFWIDMDISAIKTMYELHKCIVELGGQTLSVACAKWKVRQRLRESKFVELLGEQHLNTTIDDALLGIPSSLCHEMPYESAAIGSTQLQDEEATPLNFLSSFAYQNVSIGTNPTHRWRNPFRSISNQNELHDRVDCNNILNEEKGKESDTIATSGRLHEMELNQRSSKTNLHLMDGVSQNKKI